MKILLAAGGTGGHVFPALALGAVAQKHGHEVRLLGSRQGPERGWCDDASVAFKGVASGKWNRARPNPLALLPAAWGVVEATGWIRAWRPDVTVAFGGFASLPGGLGSVLAGVPLVLHEGNSVPGMVTRRLATRAQIVAGVFAETEGRLPHGVSYEPVGLPIRETRSERVKARAALGLPRDAVVTLVMGGSQGAASLNTAVPEAYRQLPASLRPTVLHAAGRGREAEVRAPDGQYHVTGFVDGPLAWSAADLAITRAGVGTVSEAAFHGVPLIMMPLPGAADDHQRHNAHAVADDGAGRVVEERDVEGVVSAWTALLDGNVRSEAAQQMARRSPAGSAQRLLDVAARAAAQGQQR
mgnify:CR=1 FL=1